MRWRNDIMSFSNESIYDIIIFRGLLFISDAKCFFFREMLVLPLEVHNTDHPVIKMRNHVFVSLTMSRRAVIWYREKSTLD